MEKQRLRLTGLFLFVFMGISEGLEWQSDQFLHVTGCLGSDVTLGWAYVTHPGETIDTVFWSQGQDTIASLYQENFLPKGAMADRVAHNLRLNAGVNISGVQLSDTGYYGVQVTVATKDEQGNQLSETFTASALLTVVEPPDFQSEVLDVQKVTTDDTCALKRQVTLSCGIFSSLGFPPVEVMWTDPKGQVFPSTRFSNKRFDLDLPRRPLPGNYTCRVTCQSPVLRCLPPDSPLLSSQQVHVQTPREDGCSEAELVEESGGKGEEVTMATADLARVRALERNVTQLEQFVQDRLAEQAELHRQQMVDLTARLQASDSRLADLSSQLIDTQFSLTLLSKRHESLVSTVEGVQQEHRGGEEELQEVRGLLNRLQNLTQQAAQSLRGELQAALSTAGSDDSALRELDSIMPQLEQMASQWPQQMQQVRQSCNATTARVARLEERVDTLQEAAAAGHGGVSPGTGQGQTTPQPGVASSEIRLVGGMSASEGRVEVNVGGTWVSVCDGGWDNDNAAVVCRQLGFDTTNAVVNYNAFYGEGTGSSTMARISCQGNEARLADCSHYGYYDSDCGHHNDVSVTCIPHEVRLMGSSRSGEGRVEVEVNGQWSSVCADHWTDTEAKAVCRQLGFEVSGGEGRGALAASGVFGSSGPIMYVSQVDCGGSERHLLSCRHNQSFPHTASCPEGQAAGVFCQSHEVRLVGGTTPSEGRVEILVDGQWGTVCDDGWGDNDAAVVCRQMGFQGTRAESLKFGPGTGPIVMDNLECRGQESHLALCEFLGFGVHNCGHDEDIGVRCNVSYPIRLVGGSSPTEGRLEVQFDGQWGTVCDDYFNDVSATVVCRQLGFVNHNGTSHGSAHYGQGTGQIWMDNVKCAGTEVHVTDCPFRGFGQEDCSHSEDVGVSCHPADS